MGTSLSKLRRACSADATSGLVGGGGREGNESN
jgi:hypothetical protein